MALVKQRWMAEYNRPEEDFGHIAVNARAWSSLNPRAVLREKISMEDYLESRMIVDPLRLLDCDYPINGAVATVITTLERARDLQQRPVVIDSMSYGTGSAVDWTFPDDPLYGGTIPCSKRLWERSSFSVDDVDVAQVYDGFTNVTLHWMEALGFCGIGEFGEWIGDGTRINPGGDTPLNTAGGQLAEGRLHGVSFLNEAVLQLRGQCDVRQVPEAQVAVVASGLYPQCGAMVLTTE
jgi:acetyl-CoA acetyltransferase